jgi:DNA polymerase-1
MYRAYWAIPRTLTTKAGEQVNAVFGMASMLLSILKIEQPDAVLLCFDAGEETFRHQENATYKEGRAETPDDFYVQIPRIMELVSAMSLAHVSDPRYEADDFLCTYARLGEQAGMRVTIVTGDRDALQLASDTVRIAIPHKGYQQAEYLGPKEIEAKYGVRPDQVPAYKGLTGDSSDNLPGVKGIGPKTAAELLQTYGTLEGVYENLSDIRESVRKKLDADREQAFFCQRMARLVCDISPPISLDALSMHDVSPGRMQVFFRTMEFSLLARRLHDLLQTPFGRKTFVQDTEETSSFANATGDKKEAEDMTLRQMTLF